MGVAQHSNWNPIAAEEPMRRDRNSYLSFSWITYHTGLVPKPSKRNLDPEAFRFAASEVLRPK